MRQTFSWLSRGFSLVATTLLVCACASSPQTESEIAEAGRDLTADVKLSVAEFRQQDPTMEKLFQSAYGYAVFPRVGKGALVVGGSRGTGVVYERGQRIGQAVISKLSIGLQAGGQVFREVIFFENEAVLSKFKQGQYAMSAEATAAAAADGAAASADYSEGVTVFVMPIKGLMLEASIGGQKFRYIDGG